MMGREKAERLVRLTGLRSAGGLRGWRGRWALRRLVRAGDRGAQEAVDAMWRAWLREPGGPWWTHLSRWRRPADSRSARVLSMIALKGPLPLDDARPRAALFEAAVRTGHPISDHARERLVIHGEPWLIDLVCEQAETSPAMRALCLENRLAPSTPPADPYDIALADREDDQL